MRCHHCGTMNNDDMKICSGCGESLMTLQEMPPEQSFTAENIENQYEEANQRSFTPPEISRTIESIKLSLEEIDSTKPGRVSETKHEVSTLLQTDIKTIPKGGFWLRLLAFAIDQTIIYTISILLLFTGAFAVGIHYSPDEGRFLERLGDVVTFPYILTLAILTMVYYTYFIGASGQTIGKMICRLKVVQTCGEPVSYGQAFLRWVGYLVSSIFFYAGYFWIAFDTNHQGWHDKIADTYVVRV